MADCPMGNHEIVKMKGLHPLMQMQLVRRGGHLANKRVGPEDIDGQVQALRAQLKQVEPPEGAVWKEKTKAGGASTKPVQLVWQEKTHLPTLAVETTVVADSQTAPKREQTVQFGELSLMGGERRQYPTPNGTVGYGIPRRRWASKSNRYAFWRLKMKWFRGDGNTRYYQWI